MDFAFGFFSDPHTNVGILVFIDRFSKMVHLVAVSETISALTCACVETVFRLHGLRRDSGPIGPAVHRTVLTFRV